MDVVTGADMAELIPLVISTAQCVEVRQNVGFALGFRV